MCDLLTGTDDEQPEFELRNSPSRYSTDLYAIIERMKGFNINFPNSRMYDFNDSSQYRVLLLQATDLGEYDNTISIKLMGSFSSYGETIKCIDNFDPGEELDILFASDRR
jgi:hypothetical protein